MSALETDALAAWRLPCITLVRVPGTYGREVYDLDNEP